MGKRRDHQLPLPQLLSPLVVCLRRRLFAGFSRLAQTGQSLPVPEHDGKTTHKGGAGDDHTGDEGLEFGAGLGRIGVLWLIWHQIRG